jgi:hypothetical protein
LILSSKADLTFGSKFLRAKSISDFSTYDPTEPAKYSPSFHINVEGVEKIIYCNIWHHPEFAAKVWKSFTTPIPPSENSAGHPQWVMAEVA